MSNRFISGLNSSVPISAAQSAVGDLYIANGENDVRKWTGTGSAVDAGMQPATSTSWSAAGYGVGDLSGTYKCYLRYVDEDGIPSSFSAPGADNYKEVELDGHAAVRYTSLPVGWGANPNRGAYLQVWRNTSGQEITWYLDVEHATDSITDSTNTDDDLIASESLRFYTAGGFENANRFVVPPDYYSVIADYRDRMWLGVVVDDDYAEYSNVIRFSEATEPESWPEDNEMILQADGDQLTGLVSYGPYLYLLKQNHIYRLTTAGNPLLDASITLVVNRGACNQRCLCLAGDTMYILDSQGPYAFTGGGVQQIDEPVRDYFRERVNWTDTTWFHVCHVPDERVIKFFVALDDDTVPEHALAYHYPTQTWALDGFDGAVKCSGTALVNGQMRGLMGTPNGIHVINEGHTDIEFEVSDFDEESYSSSSSFVDEEPVSEEIDIDYTAKFGAFRFVETEEGNQRRLALRFAPTISDDDGEAITDHTLTIKQYRDLSSTAETNVHTYADGLGVSKTLGAAGSVVDLTEPLGYATDYFGGASPEHSPTSRAMEIELSGSTSYETKIYQLELDGVLDNK